MLARLNLLHICHWIILCHPLSASVCLSPSLSIVCRLSLLFFVSSYISFCVILYPSLCLHVMASSCFFLCHCLPALVTVLYVSLDLFVCLPIPPCVSFEWFLGCSLQHQQQRWRRIIKGSRCYCCCGWQSISPGDELIRLQLWKPMML